MTQDLITENQELKNKVNELTFEIERLEFELRDARRQLSKLQPPREMEIQMKVGPGGIEPVKPEKLEWPHNDLTQSWGHQDS